MTVGIYWTLFVVSLIAAVLVIGAVVGSYFVGK